MPDPIIIVDVEPTNRCNANCHFCPRDMTPHQGLMSDETFEQALRRASQFDNGETDVRVNFCGLGEPLLNRRVIDWVRLVREAGLSAGMSSNAALLSEEKGRALLDNGLERIFINAGEIYEEYEKVYELPFETTRDNIVRFAEMAGEDCEVLVVLVDHRQDTAHVERMRAYWQDLGVTKFLQYEIMNRGGALFVDHMQYEQYPERRAAEELIGDDRAVCEVPFNSVFIGYDGQYYLCCSDWTKEAPLGSVFDESPFSIIESKYRHVVSREPVCKTCNLDPTNRVIEKLRDVSEGLAEPEEAEAVAAAMVRGSRSIEGSVDTIFPGLRERVLAEPRPEPRNLIPVTPR